MYFRDVIGQEQVKQKLIRSHKKGRISHAQLFTGLPGSGGLPLAVAFARFISCSNPGDTDSCGVCDSCHKTDKLIHPDIHFTYPVVSKKSGSAAVSLEHIKSWRDALLKNPYLSYNEWMEHIGAENRQGNITVTEGREIIKQCHMQPFLGGYKIFILWLPEYLRESGNVLLKVLEEPAGHTVFLLVSEDTSSILTTILSRTQVVFLNKPSDKEVREGLIKHFSIGEEEAGKIAHVADGNFQEALHLGRAGFENDFLKDFQEWSRLCYAVDPNPLLQKIEQLTSGGREMQKHFLRYGIHIFREAFLITEGAEELQRLTDDEAAFVNKFAQVLHRENLPDLVNAFNDACYHIERNAHSKIVFLNLSLQFNHLLKIQKVTAV